MALLSGMRFEHGQHICAFHNSAQEQLAVAADYLADGLRRNERCLYAASSTTLDQFRAQLARSGVDVADVESSGALLLLTKAEAHLFEGRFDTERMLTMLNAAVEDALNAGFAGLRTCGDMTWLLDGAAGSEQVVEYEALLNEFFRHIRALGMCQYDLRRVPVGLLDHAGLATHSTVVIEKRHRANRFHSSVGANAHPFSTKIAELVEEA